AFSLANFLPLAKLLRRKYPKAQLVFCADNDRLLADNPGVTAAREAAAAVNGTVVIPEFPEGVDQATDFNDLARVTSLDEVLAQLERGMSRPDIILTDRWLRDVTADSLNALRLSDKAAPRFYVRSGLLVRMHSKPGDADTELLDADMLL